MSNINQPIAEQVPQDIGTQYGRFVGSDPRKKSPLIAGLFSVIPGLGQIYVGYYQRGFVHILVAGGVLSMLVAAGNSDNYTLMPLGVLFLIFFELYNIIDAGRRAALYNLSLDGIENVQLPDDLSRASIGGTYIGGISLVLFGAIALSNTAFGLSLDWLENWWPMAPIGLGGYLFYQAMEDNKKDIESEVPGL
jgi:TM2 domain-containing membrane protein YozV